MTSSTAYRFDTPEGWEIWLIPLKNGMMRCRVFFQAQEMSMNDLNETMGMEGWMKLTDKIKEIYQQKGASQ